MLLYSAMAQGKMSIAAPVSALLAAALPVIVGMFTDGFPGYLTLLGFGFALARDLVSLAKRRWRQRYLHASFGPAPASVCGSRFGLYFIMMNAATRDNFMADVLPLCRIASDGFVHYRSPQSVHDRPRGMAGNDSEWHSRVG